VSAGLAAGTRASFAIVDVHDGCVLGTADLMAIDHALGCCEIGYILAAPARGRGAASRAVELLAGWAFQTLKLNRLELHIDKHHAASLVVWLVSGVPPFSWTPDGCAIWRGRGGCLQMPKSPPYSPEFRREAVQLLRSSGRSIPQLAKELGVSPQTLRNWASQRDVDEGKSEGGLSSAEREELRRLRREVKVLAEEREILKKTAAFFASESRTR